jgi:hypothetical protein
MEPRWNEAVANDGEPDAVDSAHIGLRRRVRRTVATID